MNTRPLKSRSLSHDRSGAITWALALLLLWLRLLPAQSTAEDEGTLQGVVLDSWYRRPLPGVIITVRGTTLATSTDADGQFTLTGVPPGEHIVVFSKSAYARSIVTNVRVAAGQVSRADNQLRPEFYEMEEVVVTAEDLAGSMESILESNKTKVSLTDSLGGDMFTRLAVSDVAGALTKVTGATVADGKYAVIRGLADRYTFTTMNGMDLPSADPDRKAFQLDLLPSKFVEKIDVRKTFTPDMSGGFAGGSLDIVTRSFPTEFLFGFRLGTAYNTQSSLRSDFAGSDRSSTDLLAQQ